ncbi:hypothetical protein MKW98_001810 [Papaver atlanticum]|uniref:Uncharacterized protein n=1 Tax=Papaver atlanticum TaxID=357466 RepID=A0AAD4S9I3_9MAGN|nr:hypothetical protein MKW98_001810 [Papaver atlanticum]
MIGNYSICQKLFKHLVHMLKAQHSEIESLVTDRKLLQDRILVKYDRFVSEVRILEDQISRLDLIPGFKQRDSSLYKRKRDNAQDDLQDFKSWLEYLNHKRAKQEEKREGIIGESEKHKGVENTLISAKNTWEDEQRCRALETEVKKLKRQNENLTSKHKTEISALLSERIFLLNQLKKMESDRTEVAQANEKIRELPTSMEKMQTIVNLKANIAKLVENMVRSDIEISTQSRELTLLTILKLQAKVAKLEEDMVRSN